LLLLLLLLMLAVFDFDKLSIVVRESTISCELTNVALSTMARTRRAAEGGEAASGDDDGETPRKYHTIETLFNTSESIAALVQHGEVAPGMPMIAPIPIASQGATLLAAHHHHQHKKRATPTPQRIEISSVSVGQPQRAQIIQVGARPQRATVTRAKPQLPVKQALEPASDATLASDDSSAVVADDVAPTDATDDQLQQQQQQQQQQADDEDDDEEIDDDEESSTDSTGDDNPEITTVHYITVGKNVCHFFYIYLTILLIVADATSWFLCL
jgi:hypothetical protein